MSEEQLDRLRRELPALVARVVRGSTALLVALDAPRRVAAIGRLSDAELLRDALADFERWLNLAGGDVLLAEALLRDVEVES
ncbi:MAG TPA: hypothetical protein VFC78_22040 [Tepidisphaeraceae bacterium]|nr:hypothetical protein [Tepidisphaeraceae bacterium]